MSRGKLTIAIDPVTGSMLTTSNVSLSACERIELESIPVSRTLIRLGVLGSLGVGVAGGAVCPGRSDATGRLGERRRIGVVDADEDLLVGIVDAVGETRRRCVGRDDDRGQDGERDERHGSSPRAARAGGAERLGHRDKAPDAEQDDEDEDGQRRRRGEQQDDQALHATEALQGDHDHDDEEREAEDQCRSSRSDVQLTKARP